MQPIDPSVFEPFHNVWHLQFLLGTTHSLNDLSGTGSSGTNPGIHGKSYLEKLNDSPTPFSAVQPRIAIRN